MAPRFSKSWLWSTVASAIVWWAAVMAILAVVSIAADSVGVVAAAPAAGRQLAAPLTSNASTYLQFTPSFALPSPTVATPFQFFGLPRCSGAWMDDVGVPHLNVSASSRSAFLVNAAELESSPYFAPNAEALLGDAALASSDPPVVLFFSMPSLVLDLGAPHQLSGFKLRVDARTSPRAPRELQLWYATSLTLSEDGTVEAASNDGNWASAGSFTTTKVNGWNAFGGLVEMPGEVTAASTTTTGSAPHSNVTFTFTVDLRNEGAQVSVLHAYFNVLALPSRCVARPRSLGKPLPPRATKCACVHRGRR